MPCRHVIVVSDEEAFNTMTSDDIVRIIQAELLADDQMTQIVEQLAALFTSASWRHLGRYDTAMTSWAECR